MRFFRRIGSLGRLLPTLLLAFALCWQAGIVRAHVHGQHGWSVIAQAKPAPKGRDDAQDCPICTVAATATAYLAAAAPQIAAPAPASAWREAIAADPAPRLLRSHGWRSRAPPLLPTA